MRAIGFLTTVALLLGTAVAATFAWKSRGDLERYLKMRSM
jgi:hypothetical protein